MIFFVAVRCFERVGSRDLFVFQTTNFTFSLSPFTISSLIFSRVSTSQVALTYLVNSQLCTISRSAVLDIPSIQPPSLLTTQPHNKSSTKLRRVRQICICQHLLLRLHQQVGTQYAQS